MVISTSLNGHIHLPEGSAVAASKPCLGVCERMYYSRLHNSVKTQFFFLARAGVPEGESSGSFHRADKLTSPQGRATTSQHSLGRRSRADQLAPGKKGPESLADSDFVVCRRGLNYKIELDHRRRRPLKKQACWVVLVFGVVWTVQSYQGGGPKLKQGNFQDFTTTATFVPYTTVQSPTPPHPKYVMSPSGISCPPSPPPHHVLNGWCPNMDGAPTPGNGLFPRVGAQFLSKIFKIAVIFACRG
ncbi:hypothetical protein B0H16DRAFT_1473957 [Mycena metata]|uniref:Uncharacterized protein n=1 Tax=Mycena metata TaxID=1033252 RepID=A0AAD7MK80_9AGAR|nr:hypothetical protein B0H16DRAFT_1473957 [Mycena metata]